MEMALFQLELTRSAKRARNYAMRVLFPGLVCVPLLGMCLGSFNDSIAYQAEHFANIVRTLTFFFQQTVVLAVTPVLTSQTIARERSERTLPLLLLSIPGGALDVWLSKFAAVCIQSGLLLLSTLPMLTFAVLLGGVNLGQILFDFSCVFLAMVGVAAMGVAISTFSREPAMALRMTLFTLVIWIGADIALALWRHGSGYPSQLHLFFATWDGIEPLGHLMEAHLTGAAITVALALAASAAALLNLPRLIVDCESRRAPCTRRRPRRRRVTSSEDAVSHLIRRCPGMPETRGIAVRWARIVLLLALGLMGWPLGTTLLALVFFFEIYDAMLYVRRSTLWEDLRLACTHDILGRGLVRGFRRACGAYMLPLCLSFLVYPGVVFLMEPEDIVTVAGAVLGLGILGVAHFYFLAVLTVQHATSGTGKTEAVFSYLFTVFVSQMMVGAFLAPALVANSRMSVVAIVATVAWPWIAAALARTELLHMLALQQHEIRAHRNTVAYPASYLDSRL